MSKETIIRPKHREVLKKVEENRGISREEAMLEVGYGEGYARKGGIGQTDSWQELMRTFIPDELLAERHKELLDKREVITTYDHSTGEKQAIITDMPDTNAVKAGLDMGYKLKGKYAAEKHININIPVPLLGGDSIKNANNSNRKVIETN